MARKKNPATSLKKALDKSIDCLGANSEEITALLQQLAHTDMSQATDKEKADVRPDDKAMRSIALLGYLAFYNN